MLLSAGWSQGARILVFLVAQLNGISEVSSLVPLFAMTAVAASLMAIDPGPETSTWRRPAAWAAVLGIVPWGVIAVAQIGAGVAVRAPSAGVRVVTLLPLAVIAFGWLLGWRRRPDPPTSVDVVSMTVAVSAVVWALVALIAGG